MSLRVNNLTGFGARQPVSAATYRYFRLDITKARSGTNEAAIGELEILVGATTYPTSNMTSDSAPSPLVASADSIDGAGKEAYKAFDGGSDHWGSAFGDWPTWVQIDLGSGNDIAPDQFDITAGVAGKEVHGPEDFTFEGSNTGAFSGEETVLKTVTGEGAWSAGQKRSYTI